MVSFITGFSYQLSKIFKFIFEEQKQLMFIIQKYSQNIRHEIYKKVFIWREL